MSFNPFCLSSYLSFRYVVDESSWKNGVKPKLPNCEATESITVETSNEILKALRQQLKKATENRKAGLLLSGGIDSAILAALLPPEVPVFTIVFEAEGAIDESIQAQKYISRYPHPHFIVRVGWQDYLECMDNLMLRKMSPLHAVEVGLYKAALMASSRGLDTLILGNGADSTFGGLDKLLSQDWEFDAFVKRYSFVDPEDVLINPVDMSPVYEKYRQGEGIDFISFLKHTHGLGVTQAFINAIEAGNCRMVEPYESLKLGVPIDLKRIRNGESKYLLREIFKNLYPGLDIPEKIAFARPMDKWLASWEGPCRKEFKQDLDIKRFSGDQRWLIYCLERFLNLVEEI